VEYGQKPQWTSAHGSQQKRAGEASITVSLESTSPSSSWRWRWWMALMRAVA